MKSIPYGLSDFKRVLEEDYYYVDKTKYIPLIEEYGNFLYLIPDFAPKSTTPPCLPKFAKKFRHYKS